MRVGEPLLSLSSFSWELKLPVPAFLPGLVQNGWHEISEFPLFKPHSTSTPTPALAKSPPLGMKATRRGLNVCPPVRQQWRWQESVCGHVCVCVCACMHTFPFPVKELLYQACQLWMPSSPEEEAPVHLYPTARSSHSAQPGRQVQDGAEQTLWGCIVGLSCHQLTWLEQPLRPGLGECPLVGCCDSLWGPGASFSETGDAPHLFCSKSWPGSDQLSNPSVSVSPCGNAGI